MEVYTNNFIIGSFFLLMTQFPIYSTEEAGVCVPPPENLVGWWPGDDNLLDISGSENNGIGIPEVSFAPGKVLNAFILTNSWVQVNNTPSLEPESITLDAWVKFDG